MKDLKQYFDEAAKVTGSNRQTALRMGITPNRISMAKKSGYMGNEFCVQLAEILEIDPMEVIAAAEMKKNPEKRKFWAKWVAATVILSAAIGGTNADFSDAYAKSLFVHGIYYAHIALLLSLAITNLYMGHRREKMDT